MDIPTHALCMHVKFEIQAISKSSETVYMKKTNCLGKTTGN